VSEDTKLAFRPHLRCFISLGILSSKVTIPGVFMGIVGNVCHKSLWSRPDWNSHISLGQCHSCLQP